MRATREARTNVIQGMRKRNPRDSSDGPGDGAGGVEPERLSATDSARMSLEVAESGGVVLG